MVKQKVRKQTAQKSARRHWFLISIFVVILLLGITFFILQRNTNIKAIAGEAIRQRVAETKQLALTDEEAKIATAIESGKGDITENCPLTLKPSIQQSWILEGSWKFKELQVVGVQCSDDTIACYYADDKSEINRADQIVIYNTIPTVKGCMEEKSKDLVGCKCKIAAE